MKIKYYYLICILLLFVTLGIAVATAKERGGNDSDVEETTTEMQTETETETETESEPETEFETETFTVFEYIWQPYDCVSLDAEFQREIKTACDDAELSYELVLAVMWVETRWSWHDGDNGNAIGYMQIWPKYWSGFAEERGLDIYDRLGNVKCGIAILNKCLADNGGDLTMALQQYNTGIPTTRNGYAEKVYAAIDMITEG